MLTFAWVPTYNSNKTVKPEVKVIKFGDGYEQRQGSGLNRQPRTYNLSFQRTSSEIDAISSFLYSRGAVEAFNYVHPGSPTGTFVCRSWVRTNVARGVDRIEATFEEVYDAMVVVAMYGDSTTFGAELLPSGKWIKSLSNVPAVIQSKYSGGVTVLNKGISGVTMPQMVIGAYPATKTWAQEMAESYANIVVLNFGINDANTVWEDDYQINYYATQLIDIAQAHGKIVVIETPNPVNTPLYTRLSQVAYVIRTLAQSRSLTLADHHLWIQTGLPSWETYLPDGIHPNAALYTYKADSLYSVLNPVVQSLITH
jgi:phage-related protein